MGALSLPYQDGQPDLLVVVNYTALGVSPNSIIDMRRSSITVRVGLDNDTDKVIHRTVPFTILPGMNLVSTMTLELRQLYKKPAVSALGLFDVSFFEIMLHLQESSALVYIHWHSLIRTSRTTLSSLLACTHWALTQGLT